jgi:prophage tail gpP-like protein
VKRAADEVKTAKQADFLARRKCAEAHRAGWELVYTVVGHTAPSLQQPGQLAVWAIYMVVEVLDDEYGIRGLFWIEGVELRRDGSGTITTLTLMRPENLVFGDPAKVTQ